MREMCFLFAGEKQIVSLVFPRMPKREVKLCPGVAARGPDALPLLIGCNCLRGAPPDGTF